MLLCGCTDARLNNYGNTSHLYAWDGLGVDPNRPAQMTRSIRAKPVVRTADDNGRKKEAELARLKKFSPEWWSLHDQIEAAIDARLAKIMVICRGCLPARTDDQPTGSIN